MKVPEGIGKDTDFDKSDPSFAFNQNVMRLSFQITLQYLCSKEEALFEIKSKELCKGSSTWTSLISQFWQIE